MLSRLSSIARTFRRIEQSAMLSGDPPDDHRDTDIVKRWLAGALLAGSKKGLTRLGLAQRCGVSRQAVQGWLSTGRITKRHLTTAAAYLGSSPTFPLDEVKAPAVQQLPAPGLVEEPPGRWDVGWPFQHIDANAVRRLDPTTLLRLETVILTVAAQLGIALSKRAAA